MIDILNKLQSLIDEETAIITTIYESEDGNHYGEITTLTEDGYDRLLRIIQECE